jgi:hypothetical protein
MNASGPQPAPSPQKPVVFAPGTPKPAPAPKKPVAAPPDEHDEPGYGHGV